MQFTLSFFVSFLETNEIQKAGGQKLRSQGEQGKGGRVGQVWGDAESPGGAQQAAEQGGAAEEEGAVHQGEGVESQEAAGQRAITPPNLRLRPAWHFEAWPAEKAPYVMSERSLSTFTIELQELPCKFKSD